MNIRYVLMGKILVFCWRLFYCVTSRVSVFWTQQLWWKEHIDLGLKMLLFLLKANFPFKCSLKKRGRGRRYLRHVCFLWAHMVPVVFFFRAEIPTPFLLMKEHEKVSLENLDCVCKLVDMILLLNIPSQLPELNSSSI